MARIRIIEFEIAEQRLAELLGLSGEAIAKLALPPPRAVSPAKPEAPRPCSACPSAGCADCPVPAAARVTRPRPKPTPAQQPRGKIAGQVREVLAAGPKTAAQVRSAIAERGVVVSQDQVSSSLKGLERGGKARRDGNLWLDEGPVSP